MAKEIGKENPVVDALKKLKEEETELLAKLKPVQEAIGALEKIVDKSLKKAKSSSAAKDNASDNATTAEGDENAEESGADS